MSEALIEAVARAICRQNLLSTRQPDDDATMATYWPSFTPEARAALAAIDASGHVVVPMKPTDAMIAAAKDYNCEWPASCYDAMIAARPKVTP